MEKTITLGIIIGVTASLASVLALDLIGMQLSPAITAKAVGAATLAKEPPPPKDESNTKARSLSPSATRSLAIPMSYAILDR